MNSTSHQKTKQLVGVALFTAIVVVLQFLGSFIKFGPFSISLVLMPIVVGAAVYNTAAGAWLGFAFGVAVLLSGDAAAFLGVSVVGTIITVLAKGTLAGLAAGVVYKALEKVNRTFAVACAAVAAPVVNTGVFLIGCRLFFMSQINEWAAAWAETTGSTGGVGTYMIMGLVGINFIAELVINIVLCPTILRLIKIGKKD